MKPWRPLVLALLLLSPIAVLVACGAWALWIQGWWWWLWWLIPSCWGIAYLLAHRWRDALGVWPAERPEPLPHWTPHDEQALRLIEARQQAVKTTPPQRLTEFQFYVDTATELALQIARHYHPGADDPLSSLTIPEILAAAHLACDDMERWVRDYVPGSHLLSVRNWRTLAKTPHWFRTVSNVSWVLSVLVNPANAARFVASRLATGAAAKKVQANVLAWFYVTFVRQVGLYLIELNSGRLRGGAEPYRRRMAALEEAQDAAVAATSGTGAAPCRVDEPPLEVTIAVVGQINAGKSSLINALLGAQQAAVDVLPLTRRVQRCQFSLPETGDRLILLDTPGYGSDGPSDQQFRETRLALQQADLVLWVLDATNPAREPDVEATRSHAEWFASEVRRKPPPAVGVLTHIDLLPPAMEWSPPYNWQTPGGAKEKNILAAVEYNRGQFEGHLAGIVPVYTGTQRGTPYGVTESLVPAMAAMLDDARACALVRTLHAESDRAAVRRVFQQLRSAGLALLRSSSARWPDPLRPPP